MHRLLLFILFHKNKSEGEKKVRRCNTFFIFLFFYFSSLLRLICSRFSPFVFLLILFLFSLGGWSKMWRWSEECTRRISFLYIKVSAWNVMTGDGSWEHACMNKYICRGAMRSHGVYSLLPTPVRKFSMRAHLNNFSSSSANIIAERVSLYRGGRLTRFACSHGVPYALLPSSSDS